MDKIYKKVAKHLNLEEKVVKEAYNIYWEFIRRRIEALPLKENLTEEEFSRLRTSFNIPSLGKLCCTYQRFLKVKRKFNYKKSRDAETKES